MLHCPKCKEPSTGCHLLQGAWSSVCHLERDKCRPCFNEQECSRWSSWRRTRAGIGTVEKRYKISRREGVGGVVDIVVGVDESLTSNSCEVFGSSNHRYGPGTDLSLDGDSLGGYLGDGSTGGIEQSWIIDPYSITDSKRLHCDRRCKY